MGFISQLTTKKTKLGKPVITFKIKNAKTTGLHAKYIE